MISPCGHDRCVHKGHHLCLPTLRPDGSGMTLTFLLLFLLDQQLPSIESDRKTLSFGGMQEYSGTEVSSQSLIEDLKNRDLIAVIVRNCKDS
jgi:hypothetical protein